MNTDSFEIFRYQDAHMHEVALHHHDFYEVYFFLSGNVQYIIESRSYDLTPGDILLIRPMELHQPMFREEQQAYDRFVLWINRRFLEGMCMPGQDLCACFDTAAPGRSNLLRPDAALRQLLFYLLDNLLQESRSAQCCGPLCALTYLAQVMIYLNRLTEQTGQESESRAVSDSLVYRVMQYINAHYGENLTLDLLAREFFISKYHLSREFNRVVGTSVHRYVTQKRLAVAKQMMTDGAASSAVCQRCGFGDYSSFYRAFKAEYQISPKEFAARLKSASKTTPLPAPLR